MADTPQHEHPPGSKSSRWVFFAFALIAGFFLLAEHRAHVFEYLPFLLLAACPLLHLFHGHGGHGGHRKGDGKEGGNS